MQQNQQLMIEQVCQVFTGHLTYFFAQLLFIIGVMLCLWPVVTQAQTTRFAVIGDFGAGNESQGIVAALIDSWNVDFVITTGDNRYGNRTYDETVGKPYCSFLKGAGSGPNCSGNTSPVNAFFPSLGNHDYHDGAGVNAYLNYFTLPGAGFTNSSGKERYYDFVWGDIHFFAINSNPEEPDGNLSTSTQALWLQAQLAASTSVWNIVYFHYPPYSSGNGSGSYPPIQWPFAAWGADVVIAGHDHTYERIFRNGIVYFVNGLGGQNPYGFDPPVAGSQVRYSAKRGAMLVEANATTMTLQFINVDGQTIDTYSLLNAKVKVYLQGPYAGTMSTALHAHLPNNQPYNVAPWGYAGLETVATLPVNAVDWVLVELRTGTQTNTKIASRAALLHADGSVSVTFPGVVAGNYYIVIQHRNHLDIMSAGSVTLNANAGVYDFTTSPNQAFGNDLKMLGAGIYGMYGGDANADDRVQYVGTNRDQKVVLSLLGLNNLGGSITGYHLADMDMNSTVAYTGTQRDLLVIQDALGLSNITGSKVSHVPK